MDQFTNISGLHINAAKSSIFTSGHDVSPLLSEAASIGIKVGSLPVRYLGMLLTTKALSKQDYELLIDKVQGRMLSLRNKCLSYAGRLQLVKSVISSIVNFWSQTLILPKASLDEIESMCSVLVWSGFPNQTHKADYIFFACPYSFSVWETLANRLSGNRTDPDCMDDHLAVCEQKQSSDLGQDSAKNGSNHQVVRIIDKAIHNRITYYVIRLITSLLD